ncbi:MAG: DUF4919 domain-containing protein [Muribaculaceae bacterium]|nr:DUF4919 domain-containing protein [Muribaculaceae bacterium]
MIASLIRHITLLSLLAAICPSPSRAQNFTPVDYNALDVDLSFDPAAYDRLLTRFENADPSLDTHSVARLYYAYVRFPAFDPDHNILSLDFNIRKANEARTNASPDTPRLQARVSMIASAILSSGLGTIPQAPFFVTSYDDAIILVQEIFGAREIIGRSTIGGIDAIKFTLADDPQRQHILYFNTYRKPDNNL